LQLCPTRGGKQHFTIKFDSFQTSPINDAFAGEFWAKLPLTSVENSKLKPENMMNYEVSLCREHVAFVLSGFVKSEDVILKLF
jgi:hypothetical protein